MKNRLFIRFILSLSMLVLALPVKSQEGSCEEWIAALKARQGRVETQVAKNVFWTTAELEDTYCFGDKLRTFQRSRATVLLHDKSYLRLNQNTITGFPEYKGKEKFSIINLIKGAVFFRSRVPRRLEVETPFVNAVIKGTEFLVVVKEDETQVTVFEGVVETTNKHGQLTLNKGETAIAKVNQPPRRHILVKPENAVQWALYYPPVIDFRIPPSDPAVSNLESAFDAYRRGDLSAAFDVLDRIPEGQRSNTYFTLRSGLLLTVGRVDEAQPDIARVLAENPGDVNAISLKSIIAVAQNDNDEALGLAEKAVNTDPQSAPALIALSYAQQARFELEAARESLEKAVELAPGDALAWARLAELQLSFGDLDSALDAAEKAVSLNPDLERTQSVLGFAALTQIDIDKAKAAFEKAIRFDPAAPLPRLGLGLAKIRQGDLDEGTEDMEIAASLDPDNSLIRSYLGKAFYEKKDKRWAGKELAMAKELDPKDPTPWFYDAILKQTTNRPVEALHDMQKAIELNDNRAVYRSRLLLDDDLAARSASLGRIYNDLGFQQLGLVEGWKSVNADPSNYSAHRLLADNYAALPRHEIARVSELLQAQLLQPINVTPVQPQLAESNLLILDGLGPAGQSFNEFNPLFMRNRLALQASGVVGNNDTFGDEVTFSGIWNNFSYSLGQFHFETDGFRENNDLEHDIFSIFAQGIVTPALNIQAGFSRRNTEQGALRMDFDTVDSPLNERRRIDEDKINFGLRFKPYTHSDILFSLKYVDRKEEIGDIRAQGIEFGSTEQDGLNVQLQYIFTSQFISLSAGIDNYDAKETLTTLTRGPGSPKFKGKLDPQGFNAYLYSYINWPQNVKWTFGVNQESFHANGLRLKSTNPKLGLQWNITKNILFRLAYLETIKRPLAFDDTLEPTSVAGFNQLFDDFNGVLSKRYGIGLNVEFTQNIYGGLEVSHRDLEVPRLGVRRNLTHEFRIENQDENLYRAYLYWTPHTNWSIAGQFQFEEFLRKNRPLRLRVEPPFELRTITIPVSLSYFSSTGFKGKVEVTYVHQEVDSIKVTNSQENFAVVDAMVGYRLPHRLGVLSIGVQNLIDSEFDYQDHNIQTNDPKNPRFLPERSFYARFTLNY